MCFNNCKLDRCICEGQVDYGRIKWAKASSPSAKQAFFKEFDETLCPEHVICASDNYKLWWSYHMPSKCNFYQLCSMFTTKDCRSLWPMYSFPLCNELCPFCFKLYKAHQFQFQNKVASSFLKFKSIQAFLVRKVSQSLDSL